jgi:hypothetical protein
LNVAAVQHFDVVDLLGVSEWPVWSLVMRNLRRLERMRYRHSSPRFSPPQELADFSGTGPFVKRLIDTCQQNV